MLVDFCQKFIGLTTLFHIMNAVATILHMSTVKSEYRLDNHLLILSAGISYNILI